MAYKPPKKVPTVMDYHPGLRCTFSPLFTFPQFSLLFEPLDDVQTPLWHSLPPPPIPVGPLAVMLPQCSAIPKVLMLPEDVD